MTLTSTDLAFGAALVNYPEALRGHLERFFFDADQWANPQALASYLNVNNDFDWAADLHAVAVRKTVARHFQTGRLSIALLTNDFRGRLALLSHADWLRLGLCVAVLPYCGVIRRSMDGHFRRAIRQSLDEAAVAFLDQQGGVDDGPAFLAGAGAWRTPQAVALGGVRAAIEQACGWSEPVRNRFYLHFDPQEREVPPSVGGLNSYWLELACKTIFPDPHWLWS